MKRLLFAMQLLEQMTRWYCQKKLSILHLFKINMIIIVINILLVTNLIIYAHGLPRMARWSSCGLNHIHLEQKCGHSTMVNSIEGQTPT
jgi:hypothetical protein